MSEKRKKKKKKKKNVGFPASSKKTFFFKELQDTLSSGSRLSIKLSPIALQSLHLPNFNKKNLAWLRIVQIFLDYTHTWKFSHQPHFIFFKQKKNVWDQKALRIFPEFDDIAILKKKWLAELFTTQLLFFLRQKKGIELLSSTFWQLCVTPLGLFKIINPAHVPCSLFSPSNFFLIASFYSKRKKKNSLFFFSVFFLESTLFRVGPTIS